MASWVSPSIAADLWKMPVSEVLARIARGELQSKLEGEFTFINIDSASTVNGAGDNHHARLTPPTFSVVTYEEEQALLEPIDFAEARKIASGRRCRPMAA